MCVCAPMGNEYEAMSPQTERMCERTLILTRAHSGGEEGQGRETVVKFIWAYSFYASCHWIYRSEWNVAQ